MSLSHLALKRYRVVTDRRADRCNSYVNSRA